MTQSYLVARCKPHFLKSEKMVKTVSTGMLTNKKNAFHRFFVIKGDASCCVGRYINYKAKQACCMHRHTSTALYNDHLDSRISISYEWGYWLMHIQKTQFERSVRSNDRMEANGQTDDPDSFGLTF